MSQSGKNVDIKELIKEYQDQFDFDVEKVTNEIYELTDMMVDVYKLALNKNLIFRKKQELIQKKFRLADKAKFLMKNYALLKKQKVCDYRMPKPNPNLIAIKPSNDTERKIFLEADLALFEEAKSIIDNHMEFITSSLETVTSCTFAIPLVLALEEFKKMVE